jgi:type II secretory pathway predicted ATPase ExeA
LQEYPKVILSRYKHITEVKGVLHINLTPFKRDATGSLMKALFQKKLPNDVSISPELVDEVHERSQGN